ncbi:MAG: hypothetical protein A2Y38_16635 [Spirochaetes bacterium GWB1_59_5]|nr:MAG: hypothetical protein A2Y38_16635 [Spirochaetes bacterium GWB1_59_5]
MKLDLIEELHRKFKARKALPVGCIRQNILLEAPIWRDLRGNAVLAGLGTWVTIDAKEAGEFDVWLKQDKFGVHLLQFRGGKRKQWWVSDCQDLMCLILNHTSLLLKGCWLISELDGTLSVEYIDAPAYEEAVTRTTQLLEDLRKQVRIRKNSPRGQAACPRCPAKNTCDALDLENGETADWTNEWIR